MADSVAQATIIFGSAGLLVLISLTALHSSWKYLRSILSTLPEGQRKVIRKMSLMNDEREKLKASFVIVIFAGCSSFIIAAALAMAAMMGATSVMLGYNIGFAQSANFDFGKGCLFGSVYFLTVGFFGIGAGYLDKVTSILWGRPELLTTNLDTLPPMTITQIDQQQRLDKYLSISFPVFMFVLLTLDLLTPFNTLLKFLVSLSVVAAFLIVMHRLVRRGNTPKR